MEPLRKRLKHRATGADCNFVAAYGVHAPTAMRSEEASWLRLEHGIEVAQASADSSLPPPSPRFADAGLPPAVVAAIEASIGATPTAVQMQALPCLLQGRDVVCIAPTGSGKTLAYLAPLVALHMTQPTPLALTGLVLAPTREVMEQICRVCLELVHASLAANSTRVVGVCGGLPLGPQLHAVRDGIDILIATPGRLCHLISAHGLSLQTLRYLVLDEVDRMVGFEASLLTILRACNPLARQTVVCSATLPPSVEAIVRSAVLDPISINVSTSLKTNAITYTCSLLPSTSSKVQWLLQTLRRDVSRPPVLVFCNATATVWKLVQQLVSEQFHAAPFVGDMPQDARFQVLSALRDGRVDVVVATDVAARGLDVPDLPCVIQLDLPVSIETFCHRAGRTGRQGKHGVCVACVTFQDDREIVAEVAEYVATLRQHVPIEMTALSRFQSQARN
ncbi:hypothetical protein SPRG_00054 [Saprolegnia parasitica CBS 223.65]|uniref:Uncharacterized protein n=1 Tax=Saprolegnia parasitica (strain CBS 223.65) TaxID=695850 RepID=A0A067CXL2_SAPPC|nr:hypothetical protein SPRG_00054 [Saprolegnia parasitica CBS 223.65]KDO35208.1 hypothetical protein SPRG_00054 [Saprolegnia parasitica CBS 223.65]|eukprot:XP_012193560.1 hypothetical protein SPRG_00054 [Saprolegnia parasitica CBS 223.65]